jgi:hypothetical protein
VNYPTCITTESARDFAASVCGYPASRPVRGRRPVASAKRTVQKLTCPPSQRIEADVREARRAGKRKAARATKPLTKESARDIARLLQTTH